MNRLNKFIIIALAIWSLNATNAKSQTIVASGTTGDLTWQITDDSVLTISGNGEMPNYAWNTKPWYAHRDKIIHAIVSSGVTTIGHGAFSRLNKLTEVEIPSTVTSIGSGVFSLCSQLTAITIPESVTEIGDYVFTNCSVLSMINVKATTPPVVSFSTFDAVALNIPVNVHCASLSSYQNASYWNNFTNYGRLPADTTIIDATICIGENYTENGFNETQPGTFYITDSCSILRLNLSYYSQPDTNFTNATICNGEVYSDDNFIQIQTGVYYRTVQNANSCDSVIALNLVVLPANKTIFIYDTVAYGETYTANGFNASEAGSYQLTLQDINGCDSVIVLNLAILNSLNDVTPNRINIYPNPANDRIFVEGEGFDKVLIYDLLGRGTAYNAITKGEIQIIDISNLPNGVYNIRVITEGKPTATKKIIKQ